MFKLNSIRAPLGSRTANKRKGRGIGSGLGKTAGKGHKGQKARSGGYVPVWFEGGQMPVQRRAAKVGFNSALKKLKVLVSVTELSSYNGRELSLNDLLPKAYWRNPRVQLTISGMKAPKNFPKSLEAHRFTPSAKAMLEKAGVSMKVIESKTGIYSTRKAKK